MSRAVALVVIGLAGLAGCSSCSSGPAATTDFFGSTVEPPRGLDKIKPGMSAAEAKRLVPGLHEPAHKGIRDELVIDSGASDVTLEVRLDGGTVARIVAIVQGHTARDLLERAWGKPQITHDSLGQPEVTWPSETTGWKVKLDCLERNCLVDYLPYHVLTADYFGAHIVPPGELATLRIGMKAADAKALAPGPVSARNGIATEIDGVTEYVQLDDKLGIVKKIYLNLPAHAEDLIAEAWGVGTSATEQTKPVTVWLDAETGWRATLGASVGYSLDLHFDTYLPRETLFGDQPDKLDGLPEPVLGRTVDEVRKAYKDDITVVTPNRELLLTLPPTEWELAGANRAATRISLGIAGGKVEKLSFALPYKSYPPAREAQKELFGHKWGEPKEIDENGKKILVFREEDPRVEIQDDKEHDAWQIVMIERR